MQYKNLAYKKYPKVVIKRRKALSRDKERNFIQSESLTATLKNEIKDKNRALEVGENNTEN